MPVVIGLEPQRPSRPRLLSEHRRRPSAPPRCDHRPPPSVLARCYAHVGAFGLVCVATYAFMIGSMIAATVLWGV